MSYFDEERVQQLIGEHEALTHDVYRLFDELTEEQLTHMKILLTFVNTNPSPRVAATLLIGHIEGKLSARFDICLACGKNHAKELGLEGPDDGHDAPPAL